VRRNDINKYIFNLQTSFFFFRFFLYFFFSTYNIPFSIYTPQSMSSPTSTKSPTPAVRRGPTLRGGRYRPGIGKSVRVPQRRSSSEQVVINQDEEERIGLTAEGSTAFEEDNEKYDAYDSSNRASEKLETDEHGKPIYQHGDETFGDLLTHPIEELHAHQHRKEDFQSRVGRESALGANRYIK
jgi:hypothetical protein